MTLKEGSRRLFGFSGDVPLWRDERAIRAVAQLISAALLIGAVAWLVSNFIQAAEQRGLPLGYDFLSQESGFPIGESVIEYDPSRPFLYEGGRQAEFGLAEFTLHTQHLEEGRAETSLSLSMDKGN